MPHILRKFLENLNRVSINPEKTNKLDVFLNGIVNKCVLKISFAYNNIGEERL